MAATVIAKRLNLATRTLVLDVQDDFGTLSQHTLPLMADSCPHCGFAMPASLQGTPDINAAITAVLASVDQNTADLTTKLQAAGIAVAIVTPPKIG